MTGKESFRRTMLRWFSNDDLTTLEMCIWKRVLALTKRLGVHSELFTQGVLAPSKLFGRYLVLRYSATSKSYTRIFR